MSDKPGKALESRAQTLLLEALNYDDLDMPLEAYQKYCESMNALMNLLREEASAPAGGERQRKLSSQSVKIAQKCVSRMSELVDLMETPDGSTADVSRRLSLLSPLGNPPSSPPVQGVAENEDKGEKGAGSDMSLGAGDYLDAVEPMLGRADSAPSPSPSQDTLPRPASPAVAVLEEMRPKASPATNPPRRNVVPPGTDPMSVSLRLARKQFVQTQIKSFDPKKAEEVLANIISKRQKQYSSLLNDRLGELFQVVAGKVKEMQRSYKERVEEEAWRLRLGRDLGREDVYVLEPIVSMIAVNDNPVAQLTHDFMARQRDQLAKTDSMQRTVNEMHLFTFKLIDLLKHNHAELYLENYELNLKLSVQHFMFTTSLGSLYMSALRALNAEDDKKMLAKFCDLACKDAFGLLGIREKYRFNHLFSVHRETCLRDGEGFLAEAADELRMIQLKPSPYLKLTCVSEVCNMICQTVHKLSQPTEGPTVEVNIGSEDLLGFLAFVMIRARIPDIVSQFAFISDLIPEEILRGESGYVLATLQTCLSYIEHL